MTGMASVLAFLYPAAVPAVDYLVRVSGADDHIAFWNPALGAQPSEGALATTQASAPYLTYISAPAVLQRKRDAAAADLDSDATAEGRKIRAVLLVALDEINILRSAAGLSARTANQLRNAVKNKITSGDAD